MKPQIFLFLVILAMTACKRSATVEQQPSVTNPQSVASTPPDTSRATPETTAAQTQSTEPSAPEKPLVPAKPKICDPNFTKLSSPKKNQYVIYVTNFNPEEFKCWVTLEEYGTKTCGGNPGVVIFVDNATIKTTTTPPNYIDDITLKSAGIGRYEYNGKYWELKGASLWKRSGKGYSYYNTDNQLGG